MNGFGDSHLGKGLALAAVILAICLGIGGCDVLCHLDEIVWAARK